MGRYSNSQDYFLQRNTKKREEYAYRKIPKISDTRKFAVITLKVKQDGLSLEYCIQKMQRELQTV